MEALGINLGYILIQIFNFAILFVVLRVWVYKPVLGLLEKRRNAIAKAIEDNRIASESRASAEKDAEKLLNDARSKSAQEARDISARAEEQGKEIVKAAEAKAAKVKETALAEVEQERVRVLSDVRSQVAALAVAAAQKLIGEALDAKKQRALIDEFFSGVKAGKVTVVEGADVSGAAAVVTSALPLTKEEQDTVQSQVVKALGGKGEVTFKVDPNILGGLVVRVGDKLLDGSVSGQLNTLRQTLK